jgi:hypothetical protein
MSTRSNIFRWLFFGLMFARSPRQVRTALAFALLGGALLFVVVIVLAVSASTAELPDEMLGAWCFDKLKTRALAAEGEYYYARTPMVSARFTVAISSASPAIFSSFGWSTGILRPALAAKRG